MKLLLFLSALLAGLAGAGDRLPVDARAQQSFIGVVTQACGEELPAVARETRPGAARPDAACGEARQWTRSDDRLVPSFPRATERRLE